MGDWKAAYARARSIVSKMTLLEKVNLTTGVGYVYLRGFLFFPRLNFPIDQL